MPIVGLRTGQSGGVNEELKWRQTQLESLVVGKLRRTMALQRHPPLGPASSPGVMYRVVMFTLPRKLPLNVLERRMVNGRQ